MEGTELRCSGSISCLHAYLGGSVGVICKAVIMISWEMVGGLIKDIKTHDVGRIGGLA